MSNTNRRQKTEIRSNRSEEEPRELTPREKEQRRFKTGNRKQRRAIAKRNGFYKDKSNRAWREANRMIREDDPEIRL